jgi:hypothetical protein
MKTKTNASRRPYRKIQRRVQDVKVPASNNAKYYNWMSADDCGGKVQVRGSY